MAQTYAESIVSRGLAHADRRAALSDELFESCEEFTRAIERARELIAGALDGSLLVDSREIGPAEVAVLDAEERHRKMQKAALVFLLNEGGMTVADISGGAEAVMA